MHFFSRSNYGIVQNYKGQLIGKHVALLIYFGNEIQKRKWSVYGCTEAARALGEVCKKIKQNTPNIFQHNLSQISIFKIRWINL